MSAVVLTSFFSGFPITNKTNKPVGIIGGQYCLPDQKIVLKDKEVFCDVYDEDGNLTGEKMILPGLRAMEIRKYIEIEIKEDAPKKVEKAEEPVVEEEKPKKTTKKKSTKKTEE